MPQPNGFAVRDSLDTVRSNLLLLPLIHAAAALGWLAAASGSFWLRSQEIEPGPVLAVAGTVLAACALVQLRSAWLVWRRGAHGTSPLARLVFWRSFALGTFVAYLAALVVGPAQHAAWAWLAAVCVWQTLLVISLDSPSRRWEKWRGSSRGRVRHLAWFLYAPLVVLVAAEVGLRAYRATADYWPAGSQVEFVAGSGGLDQPSAPHVKSARFRVAIVGSAMGCESDSRGYLARLEQAVPAVDVVSLAPNLTWPGATMDTMGAEVRRHDPDLVLAVLSVCEDLAREPARCGYFDWRQFELASLVVGAQAEETRSVSASADDFESFLRGLRPQLAACRTPIDPTMKDRWSRVFASLDEVIVGCREAGVPVALVVLPAQFQVNPTLAETLLRRNGLSADRFDVGLPQRRLADYALARSVPLIDLLPHLRLCRQSVYRRHSAALSDEGDLAAASAIGGWLESRYGGQLADQLSKAE